MNVLERIDELRKERGWSINYLAMEAGLTQSTVNNIFIRHSEPKLSTLRAICDAFGISLSTFFEAECSDLDSRLMHRIQSLSVSDKEALLQLLNHIS